MSLLPLEALYARLAAPDGVAPDSLLPAGIQQEIGHFNIFRVADLLRGPRAQYPIAVDRRAFYKISLLHGRSRVEYADQAVDIQRRALWFTTRRGPCRWLPHDPAQAGYYCVFTEDFLLPARNGTVWQELPVFQLSNCPVWELTDAEYAALEAILQKMEQAITSGYVYKYDLLRAYLLELIHHGQQLQPGPAWHPTYSAAARLAARFADLLERQFPLDSPRQQVRLRAAQHYADALAVHVNHLNRVLKETTGHTTTTLISSRVAQEAKHLLKHTQWSVSEIAGSLGFANVGHFCAFFKRQTTLTPGDFRG